MKKRGFPKGVSEYQDRHGKWRLRYRAKGQPTRSFKAAWGTPEAEAELAAFRRGDHAEPPSSITRHAPGSIADLVSRFLASGEFRGGGPSTQIKTRGILDAFRTAHGTKRVAAVGWTHLEAIVLKKAEVHPAAARNMRKTLKRLFRHAVKVGMIASNPMDLVGPIRHDKSNTGFHAWTEEEIATYRAHWPLGTKQRLAMELLLWTDQRRGDMVKMGPQHVRDGRIHLRQGKGSKAMGIPIAPQLATAIAATPVTGHMAFLVTAYGKPFTPPGFGIRFKEWCRAAGLPHCSAHGLRKAMARRMGELGATNLQIKAVGGWSNDREVAIYTESANQIALAETAIALVSDWEMANPETRLAKNG